jgi:hypothetical protein
MKRLFTASDYRRRKLEDNIRMDVREIGCEGVDLMYVALNGNQ